MTISFVIEFGPATLALGAQILATLQDFTTKLDAIQTTIDAVKTEIASLKAQLAAGGLTADEEAQVLARLDTLETNLQAAQ